MSADPIIYCLERISDYREFERLCSALLAGAGYPGIDPLGGTGDEGRDAIIRSDAEGRKIGFAYTVRSDWRVKLASDSKRVHEKGHDPDVFVFACTEALSASEKDFAHKSIAEKYGCTLDLFDLERLRVQLVGPQRHLIAQHPGIFTPPFFPQKGGESIAESKDTLLIDHVLGDHAVATWLARRLSLAGFRTWCYGTAPLAGENADETVRRLLEARAIQYLPVISTASLSDGVFIERCTIAATKNDFVIPCWTVVSPEARMPSRIANLVPADFNSSWNIGLEQVLARLGALGTRPSLDCERGRQIALRDYLPTRVTVAKPEPVYANVFPLHLPQSILIFDLRRSLKDEEKTELRRQWAFVELTATRLAAFSPPVDMTIPTVSAPRIPEFLWEHVSQSDGKKTFDIVKELIWRSLEVVCVQKGLKFCNDRKVLYFPERDSGEWNQSIQHVDGRSTTVQLTGERTKGWGDRASPFLYQLAPQFRPQRDADGKWSVVVRVYVRVTTHEGAVFEGKEIGRRRKIVTRNWWNKEWLARLLGVVQALETSQGSIEIGEGKRAVVMYTKPLSWMCPVGLDVRALSDLTDIGEEIAQYRARESDDDEGDTPSSALE
ncbi:restriction endonuclease [Cupriavidus gilardii]|uniref:Restriction endonuclease n=1 Tax=Cupriavidus gilardii TaxID=82541 RepID=A0ABY4VPG5_9BURK|nr:restriction endonuclease [Cupriavidus gilardii]USE77243.1 restriction endonuclease [Cupriavidus gilardii]